MVLDLSTDFVGFEPHRVLPCQGLWLRAITLGWPIVRSCENLHPPGISSGLPLKRFVVQCMKERPRQIGVTGVVVAASGVDVLSSAGRDGLADRHQRLGHVGPAGVELQPVLVNNVIGLQHQTGFDLGRVAEGGDPPGRIGAPTGPRRFLARWHRYRCKYPITVADTFDKSGLSSEINTAKLMALEYAEFAAWHPWICFISQARELRTL